MAYRVGTYNDYKKQGYNDFISQMFAKMDMETLNKATDALFTDEAMAEEEQREMDHKIYTQQMDRLTDIIKINHKKLNYWFHLDNPDGFAFPDEVWSLIKSYNPTPPKIKLKNLKMLERDGNIKKVMKLTNWKTIAEDDRWDKMGAWYLHYPHGHFCTMWRIMNDYVEIYAHNRDRIMEANNCSIEEIREYCKHKEYLREDGYANRENTKQFTNIQDPFGQPHWREDFWFVYVSFKTKRFVNMRFVKVQKDTTDFHCISDNTITKKVKKNNVSNEFMEITLTAKDRRKLCGGQDTFYSNINIQECMPVEIIKNAMPNSKVMKAFEKIKNKTTKKYFNWRRA